MKILVTNDDGVNATGIKALVKELLKLTKDITVCAPKTEQSATSHGINLKKGFSACQIEDMYPGVKTYCVDGTPADCVIFATNNLHVDYDVVFSGCNRGYNLSYDIIYSGTVSGAREGVLQGKKGIAVSCEINQFESLEYLFQILNFIDEQELLDKCPLLNVNIPLNPKGIYVTFQGISDYQSNYELRDDGLYHAKFAMPQKMVNTDPYADWEAIRANYVSITPLVVNTTDFKIFNEYNKR